MMTPTLQQAAEALVIIADAGQLDDLRDDITIERRDWHRRNLKCTIGEPLVIQKLANYLQADDIDAAEAWRAVRDAVRPSWGATLLRTIVDFARRMDAAERYRN